jgi:type IV secretory pathway VirB10-like protein
VIAASLVTGLNSDLPGTVIAQVTENVRDSATGRIVVIPQGTRLVGRHDSTVKLGQRRALLVWERLVFPDGSSVELGELPASDRSGYSGVEDHVDAHPWQLIEGIGLATLLGVGTEIGLGDDEGDLVRALREAGQDNAVRAGEQIVARRLDVGPTLIVRPGWPVRAIVNRDLVLRPWGE